MSSIRLTDFELFSGKLDDLPESKLLINTINAHSYNLLRGDPYFVEALRHSDVLLPDGISVVWALRFLNGTRINKIAGADLFFYEMHRLNGKNGSCFFLGSSRKTLDLITGHAASQYPNVRIGTHSPPFKPEFSDGENEQMIDIINNFGPDVLFVGMTAPKQEKWAYEHMGSLVTGHICSIGAVFDFYAGTVSRAPEWMISLGLEWFYRLIREPGRMWKRYLIGNSSFIWQIMKEKFTS